MRIYGVIQLLSGVFPYDEHKAAVSLWTDHGRATPQSQSQNHHKNVRVYLFPGDRLCNKNKLEKCFACSVTT